MFDKLCLFRKEGYNKYLVENRVSIESIYTSPITWTLLYNPSHRKISGEHKLPRLQPLVKYHAASLLLSSMTPMTHELHVRATGDIFGINGPIKADPPLLL